MFHSDLDRRDFLRALDKAAAEVEVSDWDAKFIESNLERTFFTSKQRDVINKLYRQYKDKIKF